MWINFPVSFKLFDYVNIEVDKNTKIKFRYEKENFNGKILCNSNFVFDFFLFL